MRFRLKTQHVHHKEKCSCQPTGLLLTAFALCGATSELEVAQTAWRQAQGMSCRTSGSQLPHCDALLPLVPAGGKDMLSEVT